MAQYLCLITVLSDASGGPPQPPLGIWGPTDPRPTPPIAGPGRPPWWGMAQDPGYGVPMPPPGIWGPGDPRPTNPIAGPGRGPNWGMANDPGYGIDIGQQPPLVIWGPGDPRPTNPIARPGNPNYPGGPPYPSQGPGFPTNPIAEPPWGWGGTPPEITLPPEVPDYGPIDWKTAWTPQTGWIVVGIPQGPIPTPSKK